MYSLICSSISVIIVPLQITSSQHFRPAGDLLLSFQCLVSWVVYNLKIEPEIDLRIKNNGLLALLLNKSFFFQVPRLKVWEIVDFPVPQPTLRSYSQMKTWVRELWLRILANGVSNCWVLLEGCARMGNGCPRVSRFVVSLFLE